MTRLVAESRLSIRTPEGVEFSLPLAGTGSRMSAAVLDIMVVSAVWSVIGRLVTLIEAVNKDIGGAIEILGYFVLSVGYPIATEWYWRGQTVGKRVLGLRVADARGGRLQPSQVILRNILRAVDILPALYLVGGISSLLTAHRQRLGDLVAGTIVTQTRQPEPPELDQILGGRFNSLSGNLRWAARLRQETPPALANAAIEALMRREALSPEARLDVFGSLAEEFRQRAPFPGEGADHLSDEQYLRNVVEVLFRSR